MTVQHAPKAALLVFAQCLLVPFVNADGPTPFLIQTLPAYTSLAHCAESQVRAIVHGMSSGCHDGWMMTSYNCFCSSHSSYFSSIISTAVASACVAQPTEQAGMAVDLFSDYCQLSATQAAPAVKTSQATATPAPAPAAAPTQPLVFPADPAQHGNTRNGPSVTIPVAVGVAVAFAVLIGLSAVLIWLRKRKSQSPPPKQMDVDWDDESIVEVKPQKAYLK